jgi:hypothetical protein
VVQRVGSWKKSRNRPVYRRCGNHGVQQT